MKLTRNRKVLSSHMFHLRNFSMDFEYIFYNKTTLMALFEPGFITNEFHKIKII
jgi:hypothetical protein